MWAYFTVYTKIILILVIKYSQIVELFPFALLVYCSEMKICWNDINKQKWNMDLILKSFIFALK